MRTILKIMVILSIFLSLSSCQSLTAFNDYMNERAMRKKMALANVDFNKCLNQGFTPNTDAFRLCLDNRAIERKISVAEKNAQRAAAAAGAAAAQNTPQRGLPGCEYMIGVTC